jgi:hypothetical protein
LPRSYNVKYSVNENFFEKIDTQQKAYTLGMMYADGCVYKNTMIVGVTDKEIVDNIKSFLEYEGLIEEYKKDEKSKLIYKLRVKRAKLLDDLIKNGCPPKKSLILKFPSFDIVPENLMGHFTRGWFDGDGCICYTNRKTRIGNDSWVIMLIGTKEFLEGLCNVYGLKGNYRKATKNNTWTLLLQKKSEIEKFLKIIYKDSTVSLTRKREKAEQCLEDLKLIKGRN